LSLPINAKAYFFVPHLRTHSFLLPFFVPLFYQDVPNELMPAYTYVNLGVEAAVGGKLNPWMWLESMANPEDHVVIKLDIDTPHIENALVAQLIASPLLLSLIDEMFYEHHVTVSMMKPLHWGVVANLTLRDSYDQFTALRRTGVRMHSWP
jgi:hypothetical protein